MTSVDDLVGAVGPGLLQVVAGSGSRTVRDVSLLAAGDRTPTAVLERDDLVLCVAGSTATPESMEPVLALLEECGRLPVAGVALTRDVVERPGVREAAAAAGTCLLAVPPGTAWAQLVWLLIGLLDAAPPTGDPGGASTGFGELFTLADALEAVLGGPVTIEDAASRVLAHSARQEGADPARLSTIVGRRVPAELTEQFRSMGVLRRLQQSDDPVAVPAWAPGISPRLAIPVRAGRELLGSIWAVVDHPVPAAQADELRRVVSVLALHLLRLRAQEDLAGRLEVDRLRAALTGEPLQGWVPAGPGPWRVVALAETDAPERGQDDRWRAILRWNGWRTPLVAEVDGTPFAVVSSGPASRAGSWAWLRNNRGDGRLAASAPFADGAGVSAARLEAAEVLALPADGAADADVVAAEDAWAALVVARAAAAAVDPRGRPGPVLALLQHDRDHDTRYAVTLAASLRHPGDPRAAAASLHVHPNTFRYRMRRLGQVTRIDLDDPHVRLAVQLQLLAAGIR